MMGFKASIQSLKLLVSNCVSKQWWDLKYIFLSKFFFRVTVLVNNDGI